ncbi:MAG: hypothetical protein ACKVZJ_07980 [Phycisphaerales bacterium]
MARHFRSGAVVVTAALGMAGTSLGQCVPVWVKMNPAHSPSPRFFTAAGTFNGEGVLFGGLAPSGGVFDDLWTWNGTDWTLRFSSPLAARYGAAGATITLSSGTSEATAFCVLGGRNQSGSVSPIVLRWFGPPTFDTNLGDSFGERFNHGWAGTPNPGGGFNLALGGGTCAGMIQTAKQITLSPSPNVPPPFPGFYRRSNMAMVWDTILDRAVVIHGNVAADPCNNPVYDGIAAAWSPTSGWSIIPNQIQPVRANLAGAYTSLAGGDVVIFGGETQAFPSSTGLLGDTWYQRGGSATWQQLPGPGPSPRRAYNNMAWVPNASHFVLFGGHDGGLTPGPQNISGYLGDTWVLTYRPIYTLAATSRTVCPTQSVPLQVTLQGPASTSGGWQFRIVFAKNGLDTGWLDTLAPADCSQPGPCFYDGTFYGVIANWCTPSFALFTRLPSLALADRVFFRYAATTACEGTLSFSPQMEASFLPDLNADLAVNTADLIAFLAKFGQTTAPGTNIQIEDFNGDRAVNTPDLVFFLSRFGQTCL